MRSAIKCCGVGINDQVVDEFCLRVRWAACELGCHQLKIGRNNMTAEDAVAVQLACQALGGQASSPALDLHAGHDNSLPRVRHSESTGTLTANELHTIRSTVSNAVAMVDAILVEKGMLVADDDVHPASIRKSMDGTKWGALQPYFGRFRLDTDVEHLVGPSQIPPIARPIEMTSVPDSISTFQEMCHAMRNCLNCCTLLANQDSIIKNSYCLRAALIQHLFTHVIPLPLSLNHKKRKSHCFWVNSKLMRDTQCEIFLLIHLLTRHYGAATMSLKVTRSFDGARIVTLACIAACADALLRKIAYDLPSQLSLHYSGETSAPMCTPFYVDTNTFASESACLKFCDPELATSRCMVLDYFHSLRTRDVNNGGGGGIGEDSVLFRFIGGVGLGKGETRLIQQLCIQMGYPYNDTNDQLIGQYLSGENRALIDVYPELGYFRDINFMLRLLMVPSNEHLPRVTKWKPTDAELSWSYIPLKKSSSENPDSGSFQVVGFQNRILSWKIDKKRETQSSEIVNENVSTGQNRGFITRLFLGKGKRVGRAPQSLANPSHLAGTEIIDEEDVLHVKDLPTFNNRLPARQCEVLLQFLTVPYMRIPLVMQWFSQPLQVMLLNVTELQEILDACLFEPGAWSPEGTKATRIPLLVPPTTFDHMVTPCGLLFKELTTSPKLVCTAMEDLLIQAVEMDTGTWSPATSEVLLYIVRLVVRVESFLDLILERANIDDDDDMKMNSDNDGDDDDTNTIGKWSSACCARGLSVAIDPSNTASISVGGDSDDPVDVLRHAKRKLRSLLDHRVIYILERWCNDAMKSRKMAIASKLHAHLAYMQKNRQPHEYRKMSVSILLIAQMFLTSRVNFDSMEESELQKSRDRGDESLVHQLGIPQTEIFDLFQKTRGTITLWLRKHANEKNEIMEAIVRVVTLTGTRKQDYDNDTTEDRGDVDTNREWVELSSLNKYGLISCQGRWVPTTEHDPNNDAGKKIVQNETFENWLRRTTAEAADTEINIQFGEFALKKNRVETLPLYVRKLPDFIQVFGNNEINMGVAAATVQKCEFRYWLRLVGRRHDVQLWTKPPLSYYAQNTTLKRVYNPIDGVGGGLLISEGWIRDVLEPVRKKWFPDVPLYLRTQAHSEVAIAARLVGHWPDHEAMQMAQNMASETSKNIQKNQNKVNRSQRADSAKSLQPKTRIRELIVLKQPPCVQIFDVVEHGRRFYRTLVYASDVHRCLSSHEGTYNPYTMTCESKGGVPPLPPIKSSIIITRNLSTDIGRQCFIPSRFLNGLLPECLRAQYDFWQSDNNTIQGYERNPSTTSTYSTALVIILSNTGKADLSGFGNGRAAGIITRIPVHTDVGETEVGETEVGGRRKDLTLQDVVSGVMDKISNCKDRGGGNDNKPQTSDQRSKKLWKRATKKIRRRSVALSKELIMETEMMSQEEHGEDNRSFRNRSTSASSMASINEDDEDGDNDGEDEGKKEKGEKKENKKTETSYDVSSMRLTLLNALYAPAGSFLRNVANVFSRLDSFAHLLIWTTERVIKDDMDVIPDVIELPRLGLTFRRKNKKLYCDQHAGYFVSDLIESDTRLQSLASGMPNSLLLENKTGDLQLVVSALASPFRSSTIPNNSHISGGSNSGGETKQDSKDIHHNTLHHFPCGAIYEYHCRDWIEAAAHVGHYILPVHMSRQFLFTPTLASALYLLMVRFFQRDYKSVCSLAPSVVSDSKLDSNEQQLLEHLEYLATDKHPDAHACRVKLSLSLMGNEEYMHCPWDFQEELRSYVNVFHQVSVSCRLTPTEEYRLCDTLKISVDDTFQLDYANFRIEVLRRCSATYKRLGSGGTTLDIVDVPLKNPFKFSRSINKTDIIFDTITDTSILNSD
jgi:hypothetical protein